MITRSTKVKVIAFLLVTVVGVAYLAIRYVDVGKSLTGATYVLYADFETGGGIFPNASVTYRGYPVGEVGPVRLHGTAVRAELRIDSEVRVPRDLRAVVTPRSAVGEQYIDLRPESEAGGFLRNGDVIPRDRTGGPLPLETLLINLDQLVTSVNADDLAVVLDELGKAFTGNELALQKLLDATSLLINDAMRYRDPTVTLIRDGRIALAGQAAAASAIRDWAAGLARLASTVRASDQDLRRLLAAGPPAAAELVTLLRQLDPSIGTLLGNLVTTGQVMVRNLAGIRHMLVLYPVAIEVGYTITGGDGRAQVGWVAYPAPELADPPRCTYRGDTTVCPPGAGIRAPQNAPGGSRVAASIDPATGLVVTADGRPLLFGETGGQSRLAGSQSWKTLLLNGVTS